jgi:hypothetical protein
MISAPLFMFLSIFLFILIPILLIVVNPRTVKHAPENVDEKVERRGREAIAIFTIVIAVFSINVSGNQDTPLASASLALSASFLILAFILREAARLSEMLYRIQAEAAVYAGLLLFLSLYFIVKSQSEQDIISYILLISVALAIAQWFISLFIYLNSEREIWNSNSDVTRTEWFVEKVVGCVKNVG